ncbi:MAG TPA: class I SAM-dependent methyltransferase [Solirubrobacteraceae bacterium]
MVVTSGDVIWHDLECGSYRADLPLWRELAGRHGDPILDIGAGTGRVALDIAQAGHTVTALDLDSDLLGALQGRAGGELVETVCADARSFELGRHDFALCLVPMQTIQLLSGSAERVALLRCAFAHLRPGGLLACAIVTELEPFDVADGSPGPTPETSQVGETLYTSQATRVQVLPERIVIERSRRIVSSDVRNPSDEGSAVRPAVERNIVELARLSARGFEREGSKAGFHREPALVIEPTDEHVGSTVVMLRV